jgi:hypothetical protein
MVKIKLPQSNKLKPHRKTRFFKSRKQPIKPQTQHPDPTKSTYSIATKVKLPQSNKLKPHRKIRASSKVENSQLNHKHNIQTQRNQLIPSRPKLNCHNLISRKPIVKLNFFIRRKQLFKHLNTKCTNELCHI